MLVVGFEKSCIFTSHLKLLILQHLDSGNDMSFPLGVWSRHAQHQRACAAAPASGVETGEGEFVFGIGHFPSDSYILTCFNRNQTY